MEFIIQMDFLERLVTCRICGSEETRRDCNNEFIWVTDINRDGSWTHQYICYDCNYLNNRFCYKCCREDKLLIHYDNEGLWDGKRICFSCMSRLRR